MNSIEPGSRISRRSVLVGLASILSGLPSILSFAGSRRFAKKFDAQYELAVDFEIATQDGFRVRRPYVAVWLETLEGKPVRTLSLWVQSGRKGPRWLPDLRRWYRDDQTRTQSEGVDLIQTVSSPTREAGKYSVIWDGKDDKGRFIDQGEYTLLIEAARQHGTYQLMTERLKIETRPFKATLSGNVEIKGASVEFRKRK